MSDPASSTAIPRSADEAAAVAAAIGMAIPDACMPGVIASLALLASHADRLLAPDAPPCG